MITRGLDTTCPLPSACSAEISRLRKRLALGLNNDSAKVDAIAPGKLAGMFTNEVLLVFMAMPALAASTEKLLPGTCEVALTLSVVVLVMAL